MWQRHYGSMITPSSHATSTNGVGAEPERSKLWGPGFFCKCRSKESMSYVAPEWLQQSGSSVVSAGSSFNAALGSKRLHPFAHREVDGCRGTVETHDRGAW